MTPSRFGGGCMGWTFAIIFWCIALAALTIVFPIVIIGWSSSSARSSQPPEVEALDLHHSAPFAT